MYLVDCEGTSGFAIDRAKIVHCLMRNCTSASPATTLYACMIALLGSTEDIRETMLELAVAFAGG